MKRTATTVKLLILTALSLRAAVVLDVASFGPVGPYPSAFMVAKRNVTTG